MSISATTTYSGQAPVAGGSATLAFGGSSMLEVAYIGKIDFVLDGSATSATINWIDGTNVLPFTPVAVMQSRNGGNATVTVVNIVSITNATATVNFSGAGSNTQTLTLAFQILK